MEQFLKSLPLQSVLQLVIIQSLHLAAQGWTESDGCKYQTGSAICDFQQWSPPLMDSTFGSELVHTLILKNINGTIPAGVMFQFIFLISCLSLFMFNLHLTSRGRFISTY